MEQFLAPLLEIRPTDIVDIALVTGLLYTAIAWFRRTRASLVAAGILLLALLYSAARALDLQLTTWLFQGFFAVFLIVLVIIFQEEIRQLFERIAVVGLGRNHAPGTPRGVSDVLVECVAHLARERIGALIVIPGRQPLGRHVRGGIELGGKVSLPLLESLFDPHSPGHDGAVIIERDRVSRFGVHLPLSNDLEQLAGLGTRHSAALGLAERTDALCIVVSEERGTVSVARNGFLGLLRDASEIARSLATQTETVPARRLPRTWARLRRVRWLELSGCFAAVLVLWLLLVPGARPSLLTVNAEVAISNLPPDFELESVEPPRIDVTLSGPARAFYILDPKAVEVNVDAMLAELGRRTFQIESDDIRHPAGTRVESVQPARVRISLRKRATESRKGTS